MAATYTPLATTTASAASSISFTSISSAYTDLIIVTTMKNSVAGTGINNFRVRFNNDTGSNYSDTLLYGNGSTAASARDSSSTVMYAGLMGNASSTDEPVSIFHIMNYANSTTYKTLLSRGNSAANFVYATVGLWRSTSAINRVDLFMDSPYTITGTATLYGLAAA
jgi:hypothetical protein